MDEQVTSGFLAALHRFMGSTLVASFQSFRRSILTSGARGGSPKLFKVFLHGATMLSCWLAVLLAELLF